MLAAMGMVGGLAIAGLIVVLFNIWCSYKEDDNG